MEQGNFRTMKSKWHSLRIWIAELRAPFFTASVVPVILGGVLAWHETRSIHLSEWWLTLIGVLLLQAGTNTVNDYFDYLSGNDVINREANRPFDGGSPFLVNGMLQPKAVYRFGLGALLLGSAIGIYLAFERGWLVIPMGLFGLGVSYFYVEPRIRLAARGLGEFFTGLCFGPLVVVGTYYVQTQTISLGAVMAGIPIGFLIANVLFINQFPDREADRAVGKNHWVVRLGKKKSAQLFALMVSAVYISVVAGILVGILPKASLITFLTIPISLKSVLVTLRDYENSPRLRPAQALTILCHLTTGLLLSLSYWIAEV